jgi:hypothetical protein
VSVSSGENRDELGSSVGKRDELVSSQLWALVRPQDGTREVPSGKTGIN